MTNLTTLNFSNNQNYTTAKNLLKDAGVHFWKHSHYNSILVDVDQLDAELMDAINELE